ncbi:hypothetical protein HPB50_003611 [Hyalomma asiaticum]|uniref:Uncharacterized protein n=1 Tax=Hyalomma asiaticum TaxID=266040 RepID=A0ACB7RJ36_HYAAI|nr:hypothetical protein HPB50_003611 [Hyalomma asiaticum]
MKTECANRPDGVMLFAGFLIPLEASILKSQEFLYQLSMVDDKGRQQLEERFKLIEGAAKSNTTTAALMLAATVFNFRIGGRRSLFANLTGYDDQGSVLHTTKPPEIRKYEQYVNSSEFKRKLGIPVPEMVSLEQYRLPIQFALAPGDYFTNITDIFQEVLESEKVLIVNGQMDNIFPAVLFDEYFNNMTWNGSAEFRECPRKPWNTQQPQYGIAGYINQCGNLTTALALQAGHLLGYDASDAIFDIVSRFVNASNYDSQEQNNIE